MSTEIKKLPDKKLDDMVNKFRKICAEDVFMGGLPNFDKAFKIVITEYFKDKDLKYPLMPYPTPVEENIK